jgi:hypothetical protein
LAAATVKRLKDEGLVLSSDGESPQRFMLWWDEKNGKLGLVEFDLQNAIASLKYLHKNNYTFYNQFY